ASSGTAHVLRAQDESIVSRSANDNADPVFLDALALDAQFSEACRHPALFQESLDTFGNSSDWLVARVRAGRLGMVSQGHTLASSKTAGTLVSVHEGIPKSGFKWSAERASV